MMTSGLPSSLTRAASSRVQKTSSNLDTLYLTSSAETIALAREIAYLSAIFAVSLSFNVLKILGLDFSGKLVETWTSEETIVR